MSRWNNYASGRDVEELLKSAAKREGLTYHAYCKRYGIVDNAGAVQIRRREIPDPRPDLRPSGAYRPHEKVQQGEGDWGIGPDAWADDVNSVDDALEVSR